MVKHLVNASRIRPLAVLAAVALMAGLGGCGPQHSVQSPSTRIEPLPADTFTQTWTSDVQLAKNDPISRLFVRDDYIIAYTQNHVSAVLNRADGQILAVDSITSPQTELHPPVVLSDRIAYPTNNQIILFDRKHLRPWKTISLNNAIRSDAVGEGHELFLGVDHEGGGRIVCIDTNVPYGEGVQWRIMTRGGIPAAPAVYKDHVYTGSMDGGVYALTTGGDAAWPFLETRGIFYTQGPIVADLKADDYGVYVAGVDSKLYCLNHDDGKVRWQFFSAHPLDQSPIPTATTVYQPIPGRGIVAIDKTSTDPDAYNRKPRWIADAVQFLAEDDHNAYLLRADYSIAAYDKQTGQRKFVSPPTPYRSFGVDPKSGTIYAAAPNGRIVAIEPVLKRGTVGEPLAVAPKPQR